MRYTKQALGDLARIESFNTLRSPRAAARIGERIRRRIDDLARFPNQAPQGEKARLRQLVVTRTPYIVIYRVGAAVEIVTIVHSSQKRRS